MLVKATADSLPKLVRILVRILDTVYFNTSLMLQKPIDEVHLPRNSGLQTDMAQGCEIYTKVVMINIRHTQCGKRIIIIIIIINEYY